VAQYLVDTYHGTGEIKFSNNVWINKEFITIEIEIGIHVDQITGLGKSTNSFAIHYGKTGTHIVPSRRR
jgi:hypothetical protein